METWVGDPAGMAVEVKAQLERVVRETSGDFHIGVPGGSVATTLFPAFVQAAVQWSRVHVWWVDERCVPPTDPDSNYKAAWDNWLSKVKTNVHRFESVEAYATLKRLDVALLGVGPDGHVASLFPGHAGLSETVKAFEVNDSPKPPPKRLTLSMPMILSSREIWVVATGAAKAAVVSEARKDPSSKLPLAKVLREAKALKLFLDEAASK